MADEEKVRKGGRSRLKTALVLLMIVGIGAGLIFAYSNWEQVRKLGTSTVEVTPAQTPVSAPASVDSQSESWFCRDRWVPGPCAPATWEQVKDISGQLYAHYGILVPDTEPARGPITDKILVSSLTDGVIASQELLELNGEQAWDLGVRNLPGLGRVYLWVLMACGNPAWKQIPSAPTKEVKIIEKERVVEVVSPPIIINVQQEQKQEQEQEQQSPSPTFSPPPSPTPTPPVEPPAPVCPECSSGPDPENTPTPTPTPMPMPTPECSPGAECHHGPDPL